MLQISFDEVTSDQLANKFPKLSTTENFKEDLEQIAKTYNLTLYTAPDTQITANLTTAAQHGSLPFEKAVFSGKHDKLGFVLY